MSSQPPTASYRTRGGIDVGVTVTDVDGDAVVADLVDRLDAERGLLLSSSYEYPGRYTRWDFGFAAPPLALTCWGQRFAVEALNRRGEALLTVMGTAFEGLEGMVDLDTASDNVTGRILRPDRRFEEEERSRQPSVFSVVRAVLELFASEEDPHLGLYGAFGYDLAFQFEPIALHLPRPEDQRDLVLYLPDDLVVVDHRQGRSERRRYEFRTPDGASTLGRERTSAAIPYEPDIDFQPYRDHEAGGYAQGVKVAREAFARGDLFEVVTSQTFVEPCPARPAELFARLKQQNPSPYGFLINLGAEEWLVGASPEMYVRVERDRVETCPISGTIARGRDPIDDASQILALLNSIKDESELTMCTDVDRNDKSRICVPGSVKVIGRRQIELYSRLIHTVDHVEGRLLPGFDAIDAFLTHAWAVTVTGAPKTAAMVFLERHERTARAWYGGAVGKIGFDGSLNTGLTLRTIRVKNGRAEVRVGATLLWDSDPDAEESETELKAAAFLDALRTPVPAPPPARLPAEGRRRRVLLVDHLDSFVHTLANYLRQAGADVTTVRSGLVATELAARAPDLVVLSPGPGRPGDFDMSATIGAAVEARAAVFGVCLGMQGIVEHWGGSLGTLAVPVHGKPSEVTVAGGRLFAGLPGHFRAGRYHSLHTMSEDMPDDLVVTAVSDDGVVMAVEHRTLPVAGVQFHPESIMSLDDGVGLQLVANVVELLVTTTEEGT